MTNVYVPGSTESEYEPSAPLLTPCVSPSSLIFAPGNGLPFSSKIFPEILPGIACW